MARSSSGQGHRPLKAEIAGSNPARATMIQIQICGLILDKGWPPAILLTDWDSLFPLLAIRPGVEVSKGGVATLD